MQTPTQIVFRHMDPSPALETRIRERVERLGQFSDQITRCQVTVEAPHQHHHKGVLYDVRVQLHVPGSELVITREGSNNHAYEDVYVALRDAFNAAERKLEDWARRRDHRASRNRP